LPHSGLASHLSPFKVGVEEYQRPTDFLTPVFQTLKNMLEMARVLIHSFSGNVADIKKALDRENQREKKDNKDGIKQVDDS